MDTVGVGGVCL